MVSWSFGPGRAGPPQDDMTLEGWKTLSADEQSQLTGKDEAAVSAANVKFGEVAKERAAAAEPFKSLQGQQGTTVLDDDLDIDLELEEADETADISAFEEGTGIWAGY